MPELPEVETIARALRSVITGKTIKSFRGYTEKLRVPLRAEMINRQVKQCKIIAVQRRAKFLWLELFGEKFLEIHLGMTGSLRVEKPDASAASPAKIHDRAVIVFATGEKLWYNDPRKFGLIKILPTRAALQTEFAAYGVEPLEKDFTTAYLTEKNRRATCPIKTQIMKQEIVVGVGNIYASESLFRAGISPKRSAKSLSYAETARLVNAIKIVLRESIKNGGTTISDYHQLDGSEGKFNRRLRVYDRAGEKCWRKNCAGAVLKIRQAGRSTFFCPQCQL